MIAIIQLGGKPRSIRGKLLPIVQALIDFSVEF